MRPKDGGVVLRSNGGRRCDFVHGVQNAPLLANNVIALARTPVYLCAQVRASIANVFVAGRRCSQADVVGNPELDAAGRPTAGSTRLIDRGNLRYATRLDNAGVARDARPDIGAYEFVRD